MLFPARYGLPGMREYIMTGTLEGAQAVGISELDTKLVTAKEGNKLYGIVHNNTSGMVQAWAAWSTICTEQVC